MLPKAPNSSKRRLTVERERELYETILEMLREVGYDALTMDAIAARTHSSKATLYRQWGGKAELVVAAIHNSKNCHGHKPIDTGSLRGDLGALADRLTSSSDQDTSIMSAVGHAMHTKPDLKEAFHQVVIQPQREVLEAVLRRAVNRGEIDADRPANKFLFHMLIGAVIGQSLIERCRPDAEYLKQYCDAVVLVALGTKHQNSSPAKPS